MQECFDCLLSASVQRSTNFYFSQTYSQVERRNLDREKCAAALEQIVKYNYIWTNCDRGRLEKSWHYFLKKLLILFTNAFFLRQHIFQIVPRRPSCIRLAPFISTTPTHPVNRALPHSHENSRGSGFNANRWSVHSPPRFYFTLFQPIISKVNFSHNLFLIKFTEFCMYSSKKSKW